MSSGPAGWLSLVLTTLGAGAAGSIIATYGGQSRERRQARSEVLASLEKLETARRQHPVTARFSYSAKDMAELSARCVIVGIPRYLADLYQLASDVQISAGTVHEPGMTEPEMEFQDAVFGLTYGLQDDAAALLARAVWHPWLSAPLRRHRARKVRAWIFRVFPWAGREKDARRRAVEEWKRADAASRELRAARSKRLFDEDEKDEDAGAGKPGNG